MPSVLLVPGGVLGPDLASSLRYEGVDVAELPADGVGVVVARVAGGTFDVVVAPLSSDGVDGVALCRRLRASSYGRDVAVMLVGDAPTDERTIAFEAGADDLVPVPFSARELAARVRAVARRRGRVTGEGGVLLDPARRTAWIDGEQASLSDTEFRLLAALVEANGRVLGRDDIVRAVWAPEDAVDERTVDSHVKRLRRRLPALAERVRSVRGVGYQWRG